MSVEDCSETEFSNTVSEETDFNDGVEGNYSEEGISMSSDRFLGDNLLRGKENKKNKKRLLVVYVGIFLVLSIGILLGTFIPFFYLYISTKNVEGFKNKGISYRYHYHHYDYDKDESSLGVVVFPTPMEENSIIFYSSEHDEEKFDTHTSTLIRPFGTKEYECIGECICSSQDDNRRTSNFQSTPYRFLDEVTFISSEVSHVSNDVSIEPLESECYRQKSHKTTSFTNNCDEDSEISYNIKSCQELSLVYDDEELEKEDGVFKLAANPPPQGTKKKKDFFRNLNDEFGDVLKERLDYELIEAWEEDKEPKEMEYEFICSGECQKRELFLIFYRKTIRKQLDLKGKDCPKKGIAEPGMEIKVVCKERGDRCSRKAIYTFFNDHLDLFCRRTSVVIFPDKYGEDTEDHVCFAGWTYDRNPTVDCAYVVEEVEEEVVEVVEEKEEELLEDKEDLVVEVGVDEDEKEEEEEEMMGKREETNSDS